MSSCAPEPFDLPVELVEALDSAGAAIGRLEAAGLTVRFDAGDARVRPLLETTGGLPVAELTPSTLFALLV